MLQHLIRGFVLGLCLLGSMAPASSETNSTQLRPWREYHTILWTGDRAYRKPDKLPLFFQRLREMGIDTAMVHGDGPMQPLLDHRFPYYVENLVNRGLCLKWNAQVTNWDRFVTGWAKAGRAESAFVREYCLEDPGWRGWARDQAQGIARKNGPHQPLAYNLRDELSTTMSANPFDYDFGQSSMARFRDWLRTQYADLAALNAQWETRFAAWEEVKPFSTDQIKSRMAGGEALPRGQPDWRALQSVKFDPAAARLSPTRWNFAPWADFRTFMDLSLARTLDELRQAVRAVDSRTPVGIEGTQMPHAFGGYDLWRLAQVLDWVEPYDIGNAREIFGSFMPGKPILSTVFETDTSHARRRLWHLLLEGDRGCIVWWSEDCIDWDSPDYTLTAKARALAPVLRQMTSPLARLFLRAERERDPIFVHYSQPSIQVDWLLESTADGSTWPRRFSSYEAEHNRLARARNAWLKLFQDHGYSPVFISSEQVEAGALRRASNAVLVLPGSWALSDRETAGIREFLSEARHAVFAEGTPGLFDQHGRLRGPPPLEPKAIEATGLFADRPATASVAVRRGILQAAPGDITRYGSSRLKGESTADWSRWVSDSLAAFRPLAVVPVEARARIHRFRLQAGHLLAIERNIDYHMSEDLKQAGGNELLETPVEVEVTLRQAWHVYDLLAEKHLGRTNRIRFTLDPWLPSLFALTEDKLATGGLIHVLAE